MRNLKRLQTYLFLSWIFGVTCCRALPILGPSGADTPHHQQFHRPFSAKGPPRMVVRVIVSSSSSSSTVPVADAEVSNFNRTPPDGYLADSSSVFARRTDHDLHERPSIRRSFVFFTKPNQARLQWATPVTPTPATPSTAESLEPSIAPTPAYFKPTTYRPPVRRVQLWAPPTTAAPTTSVTSDPAPETLQSKDIFTAFYRAFSPPEPSVFPRQTFGFQHEQSHDGGGQSRSFHVGSSNQRRTDRQVDPIEAARTGRQLQTSEDRAQTETSSTTAANFENGSKIVTAIVSTSSSSTSVVSEERSPVFNVNYARVRPSGVMIMSMLSSKVEALKNVTQDADQLRTSSAAAEEVEASEAGEFESQRQGGPRAEALVAPSVSAEQVSTSSTSVTEAGQPVIWQMPEQVWGEPEKVWGEGEKAWSSEGLAKAAVTTPPSTSTEEEDSPKGSFFVLGEDDDQENPSEQIPAEFSQRIGAPSMEAPSAPPPPNAPQHLPDMTLNVDHSFVDPSSITSVKVAESIQLALKRHLNFKVHTTPFPTKYPQVASVSSNQDSSSLKSHQDRVTLEGPREIPIIDAHSLATSSEPPEMPGNKKFGYFQDGHDVRKYRVEERTPDGFIVGEYGILNQHNGFLRGVRYTADGTINPRLIHEALMKFLAL